MSEILAQVERRMQHIGKQPPSLDAAVDLGEGVQLTDQAGHRLPEYAVVTRGTCRVY